MNKAITVELQFFLISILWGAIILFVYDGFRIIRRLIKHNGFFLAVEDLIFWVVASVFIFAMIYHENNGIIRGFSVMGMSIGMVLYHFIFSELFVNAITKLIKILLSPIAVAIKWVKKGLHFVYLKIKKASKFILLQLKKITKSVKIALDKRKQKAAAAHAEYRKVKLEKKKAIEEKKLLEKQKKEQQAIRKKDDKKKNSGQAASGSQRGAQLTRVVNDTTKTVNDTKPVKKNKKTGKTSQSKPIVSRGAGRS